MNVSLARVSVVIPNYNHAKFLRRRLNSVLKQTFDDFEVIILDDCSTDESREILSEYANHPRVRIEFNDKNSGCTFKQWNKGVQLSHGEYVWIAESDDFADERLLARLVPALDSEPRAAFAFCRSFHIDENDRSYGFVDQYLTDLHPNRWTRDFCSEGLEECRKYFVFRNTVPNASAVLFRREVYEKVGRVDEKFQLCGDWKLWASMALTGKIIHLGEPLNYFRFHGESVRGRDTGGVALAQETLRVVRWLLAEVTITEDIREKLCQKLSNVWVPAIVSFRVPLALKWEILGSVREIDSRAIHRIVRPASKALWRKVQRHRPAFLRVKE
jgi:glycosyltransferase involved in cell wall biosynthesis